MAELNLKQIADKLNAEFTGDARKLVFWYDDQAEFAEDVDSLELVNAKVYHLAADNQFYTKYFLERLDKTTNYLVYAPFPRPSVRENHLEDMLLYSKQFFADRASLLCADLGIDERYKPVIQHYIKFFAAKDRTKRFYDLELENFTKESIEIGLLSALCKTRTASFEEVMRVLLTEDELEENKLLAEFEKYDLLSAFWRLCEEQFGYADVKPTLAKLVITLFVTYTERYIHGELPKAWQPVASYKSGNIIAFLDNLMNNLLYRERYDELSAYAAKELNAAKALDVYAPDALLHCDTFAMIDRFIIDWVKKRLLAEDTGATLQGLIIPEVCQLRRKMHFGETFQAEYQLLEQAYHLIQAARYNCPDDFAALVAQYCASDCLIDTRYRLFYYWFDRLADSTAFEELRDLAENIYTNEYLSVVIPKWNADMIGSKVLSALPLQRHFYSRYVDSKKDRLVVIISDAMRYEIGRSLCTKLQEDAKCTCKMEAILGVLPSYTKLGMAALLPHKLLEMTDDGRVLADGLPCDDLKQRETLLQRYLPNSRCVQFDELKAMKRDEIRQVFAGMDVIYIYHNQIDARGDKANTENEVFTASEEAVNEIYDLVKRLTDHVSATQYLVTADHGFLYKRDKLQESDKIGNVAGKGVFINRRFIVSDMAVQAEGVTSLPLGAILGNDDSKVVSFPISANVFKVAGGGQNYVHGGSSPQELIVPVLDIRTEKGYKETRTAQIMLVSMVQKITNLITTLDFIQTEPVSDVVKETKYRLYFISEDNERISNENQYVADRKETEPQKRIFRLRFNFKNKQYDKAKRYYLVAYDEKNELEVLRHEVVMDVAFANDFGFNV